MPGWHRTALLVGVAAVLLFGVILVLRPDRPEHQPEPAQLSATVELRRSVQQPRTLTISVSNHGTQPVLVRRAELITESLDPGGPAAVDVRLPPGGAARDIFVPHGPGRCATTGGVPDPGATGALAAPAQARLEVSSGGAWYPVRVDLPYPNGSLDRVLRTECAEQLLARTATVYFGQWQDISGDVLFGTVVLERLAGEEPLALYDLAGSVLFRVAVAPADQSRPVGSLAADAHRLEVPVTVTTARCDPHALAESKRTYVFPAWVEVGPDRIPTTIQVGPADQRQLEAFQRIGCDLPPGS